MLLGQVQQNGVRVEDSDSIVDNDRHFPVRIESTESRLVLLTLEDVDRDGLEKKPKLAEHERHLHGVGGRMKIELQHVFSSSFGLRTVRCLCCTLRPMR